MTWFAHECWYCRHKSKDVDLLVSSAEYHMNRGESPYQCKDRVACEERAERPRCTCPPEHLAAPPHHPSCARAKVAA